MADKQQRQYKSEAESRYLPEYQPEGALRQ
jgi:hypothetical protein